MTLRVGGQRADGYHNIESLVVFAGETDALRLTLGGALALSVEGPFVVQAGPVEDNLVIKVAQMLARDIPSLKAGHFELTKNLPVAAGLGGGSSDAAAALRLLARLNDIAPGDARLQAAARAIGADVPVCLDPRARIMRGTGEMLSEPLVLPALHAVLVNPGVATATSDVFAAFDAMNPDKTVELPVAVFPRNADEPTLIAWLNLQSNDLEPAATSLHPVIGEALSALCAAPGCKLARMSGSGSTCFGLFDAGDTEAAARMLHAQHPDWWVRATIFSENLDATARLEPHLERVQEKWVPVFRPDARRNKYLERDDDSSKSHPALIRPRDAEIDRLFQRLLDDRGRKQRERVLGHRAVMLRAPDRVFERAMTRHQRDGVFEVGLRRFAFFERRRPERALLGVATPEREHHRQGDLALAEIVTDILSELGGLAAVIEGIVHSWKAMPRFMPKERQAARSSLLRPARTGPTSQAAANSSAVLPRMTAR